MIGWAFIFLFIAAVAGFFGFIGILGIFVAIAGIAKLICYISLAFFLISFVTGAVRKRV